MNILVLGGTLLLGRHIVDAALSRGHMITIFNRGRTNPTVRHDVAVLRGDRDGDVAALRGRTFDLVIDTSAYHLRHVALVASSLAKPEHYVLVSTASVYRSFPATERSPTHEPLWDEEAQLAPATYGRLKRACEETAVRVFGGRASIVRPGVLVGPHDPSNRFSYWVERAAAGGEILAPGHPDRPMQLLDARDLAAWLLDNLQPGGMFNVASPEGTPTIGDIVSSCIAGTRTDAWATWIADAFLLDRDVMPWRDIPLWVPGDADAALQLDVACATAAGLRCRPLAETIGDLLHASSANELPLAGGMPKATPLSRVRETELLAEWHAVLVDEKPGVLTLSRGWK